MRVASVVVVAALAVPARADVELQNDSFQTGQVAGFESGFIAGEIGASRFIAPEAGRQLLKVHLVFGPDGPTRTITLKTYDDTAGTDAPGTELDSSDFQLTGSSSAMQELDLTANNVIVPQQFRVGVVFQVAGAPQIARDTTDGNTHPDRNFIFAMPGGWIRSQTAGVNGDWIIRAVVSGTGGGTGPDAGTGASCTGNADCTIGEYCDLTSHSCTFDCRTAADCANGSCNSLGMCIANNGGGGGCCQTGDDGRAPAVLGLVVLVVLRRRRREPDKPDTVPSYPREI